MTSCPFGWEKQQLTPIVSHQLQLPAMPCRACSLLAASDACGSRISLVYGLQAKSRQPTTLTAGAFSMPWGHNRVHNEDRDLENHC
jgi:hypothetical protein